MTDEHKSDAIRGKTIRWTFSDGPMTGKTFEHAFDENGSVTWRSVQGKDEAKPSSEKSGSARSTSESKPKAKYAALKVADDVYAVSYLGDQGYTLTVVLNFDDQRLVGFASNEKEWYPVTGTFEMVEKSSTSK